MRRIFATYKQGIIGGLIAVLLTSALPAIAAVGDALRLGEVNPVGRRTALTGSVSSQNLKIVNKHATGEALYLGVEKGNPPLAVNSNRRVRRLNSDLLDNRHANQLIRAAGASSDDLPDVNTGVSAFITAPRPGLLVVSGSVDVRGPVTDVYECEIRVITARAYGQPPSPLGGTVAGTTRRSAVDGATSVDTYNAEENCSTDGHIAVPAGRYLVSLGINDLDGKSGGGESTLGAGSVNVIWVAFDGDGHVPAPHPYFDS